MGEVRSTYTILFGKRTYHLGDLEVGEKLILEYILGRWGGKLWSGFIWLRIGTIGGSCEDGNELQVP
jgi:hypothetical protein